MIWVGSENPVSMGTCLHTGASFPGPQGLGKATLYSGNLTTKVKTLWPLQFLKHSSLFLISNRALMIISVLPDPSFYCHPQMFTWSPIPLQGLQFAVKQRRQNDSVSSQNGWLNIQKHVGLAGRRAPGLGLESFYFTISALVFLLLAFYSQADIFQVFDKNMPQNSYLLICAVVCCLSGSFYHWGRGRKIISLTRGHQVVTSAICSRDSLRTGSEQIRSWKGKIILKRQDDWPSPCAAELTKVLSRTWKNT